MADHAIIVAAQSTSMSAATTSINTLLAAEVTAAAPQPCQMIGQDVSAFTDGTTQTFFQVALVRIQG